MTRIPTPYRDNTTAQDGFTMVEMLVTVGVGLLLVGLGIAGYLGFNDRQKILSAAREIETIFQTGANKARSGDLGGCTQLEAYRLTFVTATDPVTANLASVCADTTVTVTKTYTLPAGVAVSFAPNIAQVDFPILQGGFRFSPSTQDVDVTLTNAAVTSSYVFSVSQGGDINEGIWQ